jgi:hypothetical protein
MTSRPSYVLLASFTYILSATTQRLSRALKHFAGVCVMDSEADASPLGPTGDNAMKAILWRSAGTVEVRRAVGKVLLFYLPHVTSVRDIAESVKQRTCIMKLRKWPDCIECRPVHAF